MATLPHSGIDRFFLAIGLALTLASCATTGGGALSSQPMAASGDQAPRVLSWNVSRDAMVHDAAAFGALVRKSGANILLLDEVTPTVEEQQIRDALAVSDGKNGSEWHISFGSSGGRQRDVIVSRFPLESLPEFAGIIPYAEGDRQWIRDAMLKAGIDHPERSMDGGMAMNGAIATISGRRVLLVSIDLECCGSLPDGWEELRRRVEISEVRNRITRVIERTHVDAVIVGGDFNLVMTGLPLLIASGPYPAPHRGLIAAELRHAQSGKTWTWDGRGTPFPSRALDFLFYSPRSLTLADGYILDTEDLPADELGLLGLTPEASSSMSDHRPLVAGFSWN